MFPVFFPNHFAEKISDIFKKEALFRFISGIMLHYHQKGLDEFLAINAVAIGGKR
jgi:hypothetical protein